MTKNEFKLRWESDDNGGGITFNDFADCAEKWHLFSHPKTCEIYLIRYAVLKAANTVDAEEYSPNLKEKNS